MAGDSCQMAVHKKPMGGGLSAVGGMSDYTYYEPDDIKYKGLIEKLYADIPTVALRTRRTHPALRCLGSQDPVPRSLVPRAPHLSRPLLTLGSRPPMV